MCEKRVYDTNINRRLTQEQNLQEFIHVNAHAEFQQNIPWTVWTSRSEGNTVNC